MSKVKAEKKTATKSKKMAVATEEVTTEVNPNQNTAISDKLQELMDVVKAESDDDHGVMMCLIMDKNGTHMAMSGGGENLSVMLATAIVSNTDVKEVIFHGATMASMAQDKGMTVDDSGNLIVETKNEA